MTSDTPAGEPPPEPTPAEPTPLESDAETARVPIQTSGSSPTDAPDPATPAGLISAQPTAMLGGESAPPDVPVVGWAAPTRPAAVAVAEGVVIAGTFTRVVAYAADVLLLTSFGAAVDGALGLFDAGHDENLGFFVGGILIAIDFVYFVGLWSSGLQATLGMRMLRLRVLDAVKATTLPLNDAILRWIALSGAVAILGLVPGVSRFIGFLSPIWLVVLLGTTALNPLHQGLHDRWARSVVVQPGPGGSGAAFATCLIMVVFVFVLLPIIALLMAGDQVAHILSQIGNSI